MRNSAEVNVHARALRAAERTGDSGRLPDVIDEPQPKWYHRYFKWENLTVAGREVKGFIVTPTIAAVLLAAFLGMLGWAYKTSTADNRETRDSIIRMETMLNERTQTIKEQQAKFEEKLETEKRIAELQREQTNKELAALQVRSQNQ